MSRRSAVPTARASGPDPGRRSVLAALAAAAGFVLIGCDEGDITKVALKLVSPEQLREMGEATWRHMRSQFAVSTDAALQARLRSIGERVVRASNPQERRWEFLVFRSDEINAFALPGGKVGFFEGMFTAARNDAQIAAILGHEVGHINAHHAAQRLAADLAKRVGINALLLALQVGDVAYANEIAAVLGAGVEYGLVLPYSRQQEYEADALGVEYMVRAGYPPKEAVAFWLGLMELNRNRPRPLEFLSTHPSDEKRIQELRARVPNLALGNGGALPG
jgi:predicted Zn-dependent protease